MAGRRFTRPDLADAVEDTVGPYRLAMVYRHVPNDEGPSIHVFGPVDGQDRDIRFDCFKNAPHIHLGISYLDEPVQMIDSPDPFGWVLEELGQRLADYLTRSGARCELPEDWETATGRIVETFRTAGAQAG